MIRNSVFILLFSMIFVSVSAQKNTFLYNRKIGKPTGEWNKIVLPQTMLNRLNSDFTDIRIYGVKSGADTIEIPYILKISKDQYQENFVEFKTINQSNNALGYFYTFQIEQESTINQINLLFGLKNFDWKIQLEGSQNLKDWVTILNDYRILSIQNEHTYFNFTTLKFPPSKYAYYRLRIPSKVNPDLSNPNLSQREVLKGNYFQYQIKSLKIKEENKKSVIDVELNERVPLAFFKLFIHNKFDYYRNYSVQCVSDSFQTKKSLEYIYQDLGNSNLNSFEPIIYHLKNQFVQKLRIQIDNEDNEPLKIDSIQFYGSEIELIARFDEADEYFLAYGNEDVGKASYDIEHFLNKIPANPVVLTLGKEQSFRNADNSENSALFISKNWLWAIMIIVIAVIGWFSIKMLQNNK